MAVSFPRPLMVFTQSACARLVSPCGPKCPLLIRTPVRLDHGPPQRLRLTIMTEDKMVGWHHRLDGHEFEQAPGVGDGQGSLACCSPWVSQKSQTQLSDWTELNWLVAVLVDNNPSIVIRAQICCFMKDGLIWSLSFVGASFLKRLHQFLITHREVQI